MDVLELAALWSNTIPTAETFASSAWFGTCTMEEIEETLCGLPTPGEFVILLVTAQSTEKGRYTNRSHFVAAHWILGSSSDSEVLQRCKGRTNQPGQPPFCNNRFQPQQTPVCQEDAVCLLWETHCRDCRLRTRMMMPPCTPLPVGAAPRKRAAATSLERDGAKHAKGKGKKRILSPGQRTLDFLPSSTRSKH